MPLPYTKVVLIEGDYGTALDRLLKIKRSFGPAIWTEFAAQPRKGDGYEFYQVAEALGAEDFLDTPRVVLLRGLPARKEIREGLVRVVPKIESPMTLIVWDAYGTMESDTWNLVRSVCQDHGKLIALPKALDSLYRNEQVKAVADIAMKRGVTLSEAAADVLLELTGPSRGQIDTVCDGLASMDLFQPTVLDLRTNVLPMAVDYPVYLFYSAFNSGSFSKILDSVRLLQQSNFPSDIIMSFAVTMCRWQLIGAAQQLKGRNVESALRTLGGPKNEDETKKRLQRYRPDRWMFQEFSDAEKQPKRASLTAPSMLTDVAHFVTVVLPRLCHSGAPYQCVYDKAMERFLIAYDAMVELREHSGDDSDADFLQTMRSLSVEK